MFIATVLRSGGDFLPEYVEDLYDNIDYYIGRSYKKLCLTDYPPGELSVPTRPLTEDLKGAYNQIELFKPGLFNESVLYLDIDTIIVDDFCDLLECTYPIIFNRDCLHYKCDRWLTTNFILWDPSRDRGPADAIWDRYYTNKEFYQNLPKKRKVSKPFFQKIFGRCKTIECLFPGRVVSYKEHCCNSWRDLNFEGYPSDAAIITFHGRPRPWDTPRWEEAKREAR